MHHYYGLVVKRPASSFSLTPTEAGSEMFALGLPFAANAAEETNLPSYAAASAMYAVAIDFAAQDLDSLNLVQTIGQSQMVAIAQPFTAGSGELNIVATTAESKMLAKSIAFAAQDVAQLNLDQTIATSELFAKGLSFAATSPTEINLTHTVAESSMAANGLAFTAQDLGATNLSQTVAESQMTAVGQTFTALDATEVNLSQTVAESQMTAVGQTFAAQDAAEVNLSQTLAESSMVASAQSFAADDIASENMSQTVAESQMIASALQFAANDVAATNLEQTAAQSEMSASGQAFQALGQETAPVPHAGCFAENYSVSNPQDLGFLYSDNLLPGGYQTGIATGYFSAWIKYDLLHPHPDQDSNHKQVLFTGQYNSEQRFELGIGNNAGFGAKAELYFESDTDTAGTQEAWTYLDGAPAAPDMFDGDWHHVIFGNDAGNSGWYAWVDGVKYSIDTIGPYQNMGHWFSHVQSLNSQNFDEIDIAATRAGGPDTDHFHGCIDEATMHCNVIESTVDSEAVTLYNSGDGMTIPQIEQLEPTIWAQVCNAWELETNDGKTLGTDYLGNNHLNVDQHATASTDTIPGEPRMAGKFVRASQQSLRIEDSKLLDHTGELTLTLWMQLVDTSPTGHNAVVAKLEGDVNEWALYYDFSTTRFVFRTYNAGGSFIQQYNSTSFIPTENQWMFLACRVRVADIQVVAGHAGTGQSLVYGPTPSGMTVRNTASNILLGAWSAWNSLNLDGAIDDFGYFNEHLSDAELDTIFNAGQGRNVANWGSTLQNKLIGHWQMQEASGPRWGERFSPAADIQSIVSNVTNSPGSIRGHVP